MWIQKSEVLHFSKISFITAIPCGVSGFSLLHTSFFQASDFDRSNRSLSFSMSRSAAFRMSMAVCLWMLSLARFIALTPLDAVFPYMHTISAMAHLAVGNCCLSVIEFRYLTCAWVIWCSYFSLRNWIDPGELHFSRILYIHRHVRGTCPLPPPNFLIMFWRRWNEQWKKQLPEWIHWLLQCCPCPGQWWLSCCLGWQWDGCSLWTSKM